MQRRRPLCLAGRRTWYEQFLDYFPGILQERDDGFQLMTNKASKTRPAVEKLRQPIYVTTCDEVTLSLLREQMYHHHVPSYYWVPAGSAVQQHGE